MTEPRDARERGWRMEWSRGQARVLHSDDIQHQQEGVQPGWYAQHRRLEPFFGPFATMIEAMEAAEGPTVPELVARANRVLLGD